MFGQELSPCVDDIKAYFVLRDTSIIDDLNSHMQGQDNNNQERFSTTKVDSGDSNAIVSEND